MANEPDFPRVQQRNRGGCLPSNAAPDGKIPDYRQNDGFSSVISIPNFVEPDYDPRTELGTAVQLINDKPTLPA